MLVVSSVKQFDSNSAPTRPLSNRQGTATGVEVINRGVQNRPKIEDRGDVSGTGTTDSSSIRRVALTCGCPSEIRSQSASGIAR
jgi:hypothetical protein